MNGLYKLADLDSDLVDSLSVYLCNVDANVRD